MPPPSPNVGPRWFSLDLQLVRSRTGSATARYSGPVINGTLFGVMAIRFLVGAGVATGLHNGGLVVVGLTMGCFSSMMWFLGWAGLRPVVLDRSELRIPAGLRGLVRIPLGDVAGIGLAVAAGSPRTGWALTVWTTEGRIVRAANLSARGTAGALLAESPVGLLTQDIWSRVAGSQGPTGALVIQEAQRHPHRHGNVTPVSVWDPSTAQVVDINSHSSIVEHLGDYTIDSPALSES